MWSHFDNLGPRTTNLAEGWHSGLNTSLGVAHPSLRAFLDWLQRYQFEIQCRVLQLLAGCPAKERRAVYVKVDNDIAAAKLRYSTNIGHVFCYIFPPSFVQLKLSSYVCPVLGSYELSCTWCVMDLKRTLVWPIKLRFYCIQSKFLILSTFANISHVPCSLYIDLRAIFAYVAAVELVYTRRNYITCLLYTSPSPRD